VRLPLILVLLGAPFLHAADEGNSRGVPTSLQKLTNGLYDKNGTPLVYVENAKASAAADIAAKKAVPYTPVQIALLGQNRYGTILPPLTLSNYHAHISCKPQVTVWFGKRVALIIEGETPKNRDPDVMSKICETFDGIFDAYDRVTGCHPKLDPHGSIEGHYPLEFSTLTPGGWVAQHGTFGVSWGFGFFDKLYTRVASGKNTYDQAYFYEITRNYWMPDMNPHIDYVTSFSSTDYGWWTVGFNNAMSVFIPKECVGIDDMYYFGKNGQQFSDDMESNLNEYLAHPEKYTWENSWCVRILPWTKNTSLNDLMTGLLIRLAKENGGIKFISGLYREIPRQPLLKGRYDYQGERDNFYTASSLAAQRDLYQFFTKDLRWQISAEARKRAMTDLHL